MNNQAQCNCLNPNLNGTKGHEAMCPCHRRGAVSEQGGRVGGDIGTIYGPNGTKLKVEGGEGRVEDGEKRGGLHYFVDRYIQKRFECLCHTGLP